MAEGPTAGIILAAGESRRWGGTKQLLDLDGRPLVAWVLDAALASGLDRVVLVLGRDHRAVLAALAERGRHPRLDVVLNPRFAAGQGSSLAAGLRPVCDLFPAAMFLLGDQPLVDAALIDRLLERFAACGKGICVPTCGGKRGNPVLFARPFYRSLLKLSGDKGGREIIAAHPEQVLEVEIDDPAAFRDIDTREDFAGLARLLAARRGN